MAGVSELVRWVVEADGKGASQGLGEVATAAKRVQVEAAKTDKSFSAMGESGKKVASLLGGPFATLGDVVFELGGKASTAGGAMGALGGFAAGAVVGVGALTYASVELASAAEAAAERLEKQGLAALIPDEARASVERYRDATEGLRTQADLASVTLAGPLLDAVSGLADAMSGAISKAGGLSDALAGLRGGQLEDIATRGGGGLFNLLTLGAGGAVSSWLEGLQDTGEAARTEVAATQAAQRSADEEAGRAQREAEAEEQRRREADQRAQKLLQDMKRKAHEDALKADREALAAAKATNAELLADSKRILGEIDQMFATRLEVDSARTSAGIGGLLNTIEVAQAGYGGMAVSGAASTIDVSALPTTGGMVGGILKGLVPGLGNAALNASAGAGGLAGLGAAGPVGLAIAAIVGLPDILAKVDDTLGSLVGTFDDLPGRLTGALERTLPHVLELIPDLAMSVVEAGVKLPGIILGALPEILFGVARMLGGFLIELPITLGRSILDAFKELPRILVDAFRDIVNPIGEGLRNVDLNPKGGIEIPGVIRTGGRRDNVGRRAEAQRGGIPPIVINGITDPRELARRIRRELGGDYGASYATGDSL